MDVGGRRNDGVARLFLGVEPPEGARRALEAHLRDALGGRTLPGRAVAPANWHLTLRFLGETPPERSAALVRALEEADPGPGFTLGFGGLGAFPRPARAAVLWLGVEDGAAALGALAGVAEAAAQRAGFPLETRPFSPHLTLSRIRPPRDVGSIVERVPAFRGRMPVEEMVLFRSHPGPGGVRYEAVERFPLRP